MKSCFDVFDVLVYYMFENNCRVNLSYCNKVTSSPYSITNKK